MGDRGDAQAAEGLSPDEVKRALEALEPDFGESFMLGYDEEHGWHAARRDRIGGYVDGDTPGELRTAMAESLAMKPVEHLWCSACGKRVITRGGRPVHARTGSECGPDGHRASPVGTEPPLWKAAREITADYGRMFTVRADHGFLRADYAVPGAGTAVHYEAPNEQEMRDRLDEALRLSRRERSREGAGQ
jgi:hypothetical protein